MENIFTKETSRLTIPFLGLLLIAILAPFDQFQRDIIFGFSFSRIIFIVTFFLFSIIILMERRKIYLSSLAFPLFLYLLAVIIALSRTDKVGGINVAMTNFGYILLFLVTINVVKTQKQLFLLLFTFILSLCAIEFAILYNMFTGSSLFGIDLIELQQQSLEFEKTTRLLGTSRNPNTFGVLFIFATPLCFSLFFVAKKITYKIFFCFTLLLSFICLFVTQSRAAIGGVVIGLIFFMIYLFKQTTYKGKIILLCSLILLIGVVSKCISESSLNTFARFRYLGNEIERKTWIYKYSAEYILTHPLGAGIGNSRETLYAISDKAQRSRSSHNVFLSAGVERGWLGLLSVFLIFGTIFLKLAKEIKRTPDKQLKLLLVAFMAVFIGFFITNQFHSLLGWNIVWLFFGLIFAAIRINKFSLINGNGKQFEKA